MDKSSSNTEYIFQNEYCSVDKEGRVYLIQTLTGNVRQAAIINPQKNISEELAQLEKAFHELAEEKNALLKKWEESDQKSVIKQEIAEFIEKAGRAEAVGNFKALLGDLTALLKGNEVLSEEVAAPKKEETDSVQSYYKELVEKAEKLSKQTDWPYVDMELKNLRNKWVEGPEVNEDEEEVKKELSRRFKEAKDHFETRKEEHYQKQHELTQENLKRKKELLDKLASIVDQKKWKAKKQVDEISSEWNSITLLPKDQVASLDKKFNELINEFREHKVERLVQKKEKEEENLVGKLVVLDKLENLADGINSETSNWQELEDKLEDLKRQWRKIGRVPLEKNREVWQRYKTAMDRYHNNKFKFNPSYRKKVEKSLKKKIALCEEAEALLEIEDIAKGAQLINKLHRKWKKAGNLPQKEENELWDRFKAATDAFNKRKSENIELLRKQEEEHYEEKLKLIEEAEEIKDTTEWQSGADKMQHLMKRWKKIGPVPRNKNKKIWKQFKAAMDHFYDRRREHFKKVKKEQKENLESKQDIIEQLHQLGEHEDPIEAVDKAKELQNKFKNIGYVPIKLKNKIWKQYREACDVIYDRYRAAKSNKATSKVLKAKGYKSEEIAIIQKNKKKISKLQKEAKALNEEIIQYKEAQTYFKPSGKGNALLDELQEKIDKAEEKLKKIDAELDTCQNELSEIVD